MEGKMGCSLVEIGCDTDTAPGLMGSYFSGPWCILYDQRSMYHKLFILIHVHSSSLYQNHHTM